MKMLKLVFVSIALLLAGCGKTWIERHEPTTDAERKAVAEHVEKIMAVTPRELAGHDQDWDDAINAAEWRARETLCRPTLWEYNNFSCAFTGRWKYAEEVNDR